jgi:hypothetical protein
MFELLSKLAEILAQFGSGLLASKRTARDAEVAEVMLCCVIELQDVCVCGERILSLAEELVDGAAGPDTADKLADLVGSQVLKIEAMRSGLVNSQVLLATVDAGIYLELAPFLDMKSGLLARWGQLARMGPLSTTTLFYLPAETLERIITIGKASADADGLNVDRVAFVAALADGVRSVRKQEVRDMRRAVAAHRVQGIKEEITKARAGLDRIKSLSGQLLAATEEAVGADVMAHLRRSLVKKPSRG